MDSQSRVARPPLISVGDLFRKSFTLYRSRFSVSASIMAVPVAISLGGVFIQEESLGAVVVILLGGISYLFANVALIAAARGDDTAAAYRASASLMLPYLWIAMVTNITVVGGFAMGIIPGIIFSLWFSFGPFILVDGGPRGMGAILRSKEYVRGLWWPLFARFLLASLPILFFNAAVMGIGELFWESTAAPYAASAIVQFIALPFIVAFAWTLYQSLKAAKPDLPAVPIPAKGRRFFIVSAALGVVVPLLIFAAVIAGYFTGIVPPSAAPYRESPAGAN